MLLYHFEGRDTEAAITLLWLIPGMGNFFTLSVRLTLKLGNNAGEALIKLVKKYFPDAMKRGSRFLQKRFIDSKIAPEQVAGRMDSPMEYVNECM